MKRAFSLIELLIVVAIIGILTAGSIILLGGVRSRARDSDRKESLGAYQVSIEQYKASFGHYLIDKPINGTVAGFGGQGWGRITRTGISGYSSALSIANVLQKSGYLTIIQGDPALAGRPTSSDIGTAGIGPITSKAFTDDFYLLVCDYSGTQVSSLSSASSGVELALYTNLENPPTSGNNVPSTTNKQCGTGFAVSESGTTQLASTYFNYVLGPNL